MKRTITMGPNGKLEFAGLKVMNHGEEPVTLEIDDGVIHARGPVAITWVDQEAAAAFETWLCEQSGIFPTEFDPTVDAAAGAGAGCVESERVRRCANALCDEGLGNECEGEGENCPCLNMRAGALRVLAAIGAPCAAHTCALAEGSEIPTVVADAHVDPEEDD